MKFINYGNVYVFKILIKIHKDNYVRSQNVKICDNSVHSNKKLT